MKKINVLSLFDGISCGQLALKRANIKVLYYFASEIDRNAIKITQHNFPNTIQLGDVTKINIDKLPKIDLLIGGSPCQGFSFMGKLLNLKDPRSKLFFEFSRIKKELEKINSNLLFLLENVVMQKEYENIISNELNIFPILINSKLVSAQNRERLYWTNINFKTNCFDRYLPIKNKKVYISYIQQPKDKKIYIKNIIDNDIKSIKKNICKSDFVNKLKSGKYKYKCIYKIYKISKTKSPTITAAYRGSNDIKIICPITKKLRYLTIKEKERLQTLPDNYTSICCNDRISHHAIGNGWTVDIISHIFSYLKNHPNITSSISRRLKK